MPLEEEEEETLGLLREEPQAGPLEPLGPLREELLEQVLSEQVLSEQVLSEQVLSEQVLSEHSPVRARSP